MIGPQVGKVYRCTESGMIVECLPHRGPAGSESVLFTGQVLFAGRLVQFNPVGQVLPTLNSEAFELLADSKNDFITSFCRYLERVNVSTVDEALENFARVAQ